MSNKVTIRKIVEADCLAISRAFTEQGWNKPLSQYQCYHQENEAGTRVVLIANFEGQFAGYVTIVWKSNYPPFEAAGIPEIVDFNVLKKYQRRGIGTALMDEAEKQIAKRSAVAGIGVGLTADYGPAQILYSKRGYIPDGRGIFANGRYLKYGDLINVDDNLTFYLTKQLSAL
jgi:GNAT superfamily N-acetyltransferase